MAGIIPVPVDKCSLGKSSSFYALQGRWANFDTLDYVAVVVETPFRRTCAFSQQFFMAKQTFFPEMAHFPPRPVNSGEGCDKLEGGEWRSSRIRVD